MMNFQKKILPQKLKLLLGIHLLLLFGVVGLMLIHFSNGLFKEIFFTCPASLRHLYCPGCGGTRAVTSLFRMQLFSSFLYNPNLLLWIGMLLYTDIRSLTVFFKTGELKRIYFTKKMFVIMMSVYLLNFVLRNLLLICWGIDFIGDHAEFWSVHCLF